MRPLSLRAGLAGLALPLAVSPTTSTCQLSTDASTGELRVVIGTVERVDVEGGCWRLRGDDGSRYELRPSQAPGDLLRDGLRVRVELRPRDDLASVCQVGPPADVERVLPAP